MFVPARWLAWVVAGALAGCGSGESSALFSGTGAGGSAPRSDAGTGGNTTGSGGDTAGSGGDATGSGGDATGSGGDATGSGGDASSGSGGSGTPDAGYAIQCAPGHFVGTLTGNYKTGSTGIPSTFPLSLPLDGDLTVSATAGFLDFNAKGSGTYTAVLVPIPYDGNITGRISCKTGEVVAGLIGGSYSAPGATAFHGTALGLLNPTTSVLSGTWQASENNAAFGGSGEWSVTVAQ